MVVGDDARCNQYQRIICLICADIAVNFAQIYFRDVGFLMSLPGTHSARRATKSCMQLTDFASRTNSAVILALRGGLRGAGTSFWGPPERWNLPCKRTQ